MDRVPSQSGVFSGDFESLTGRQTDGHDAAENLAYLIFGLPNVIAALGSFSRGRS